MINIINEIFMAVIGYLKADWLIILIGITLSVSVSVYVDSSKLRKLFNTKSGISIPGAVAFGTLTPLCACGTMAVLLSMFVSSMPWGVVMAFLISSPLTSPSEYVFETAFFGSKFATALLISSITLGILAGFIANLLEKKTNFFKGQLRLVKQDCGCCESKVKDEAAVCCDVHSEMKCSCVHDDISDSCKPNFIKRYKIDKFIKEIWNIGIKKILFYFILFIAVGRVFEMLIPKE